MVSFLRGGQLKRLILTMLFVFPSSGEFAGFDPGKIGGGFRHVFNAIHSSMRQWGSSINHNGVSFFLATVPEGTLLHHGTSTGNRFHEMEWLAFEPEHAMRFAVSICNGNDDENDAANAMCPKPSTRFRDLKDVLSDNKLQDLLTNDPEPPFQCLKPGWLHTYAASRDLHLLYLDGQSASTSSKGTLDSQDFVLLRNDTSFDHVPGNDMGRGTGLCKLATTEFQHRIDGFIRMEHGFEVLLCDFDILDVVSILPADLDDNDPINILPDDLFEFMEAITSRYSSIGAGRAVLNYDNFVSAYTYKDINLWAGFDPLPRLNNISNASASQIYDDVKTMILNSPFPSPSYSPINWQAIADAYVARYSTRFLRLLSPTINNSSQLSREIRLILRPYLNHSSPSSSRSVDRCSKAYIPHHLASLSPTSQSLAQQSIMAVSTAICTILHSAMQVDNFYVQRFMLKTLMKILDWTTWKECRPSCAVDEVCLTAIWPFGSEEDHRSPSCKNGTGISDSIGKYWDNSLES